MRAHAVVLRTLLVAAVLLAVPSAGRAADLVVLCSNGYRAVLQALGPEFQKATGTAVVATYDLSANLARRIESGERFDVAILTPALVSALEAKSLVRSGTGVAVAVTPIGLAIRAGAGRPDLRSIDAVRRTLLGSTLIAYAREGAAAGFFVDLLKRLNIADALNARVAPLASGAAVGESVAKGVAQFGVIPVSEILPLPGIAVGGTFPPELGGTVTMTAGIGGSSTQADAGRALIQFLRGSPATHVLEQHGMKTP